MKWKIKTELILEFIEKVGISVEQFCKVCGITKREFSLVLNQRERCSALTVYDIARVMGVKLEDLVEVNREG